MTGASGASAARSEMVWPIGFGSVASALIGAPPSAARNPHAVRQARLGRANSPRVWPLVVPRHDPSGPSQRSAFWNAPRLRRTPAPVAADPGAVRATERNRQVAQADTVGANSAAGVYNAGGPT